MVHGAWSSQDGHTKHQGQAPCTMHQAKHHAPSHAPSTMHHAPCTNMCGGGVIGYHLHFKTSFHTPHSHWQGLEVKALHHAPLRNFRVFAVSVKKSLKIIPSSKCHEILRTHSSYFSMHVCKKPHQNSISRYHFPFFRILRFLVTLKIRKIFIPWRKILKLWGQRDIMLLSMPAKNCTKIRSLGPNLALCLLRKKVSTRTKLAMAY